MASDSKEHPLSRTFESDRTSDKLAQARKDVREEVADSMVPKVETEKESAEETPDSRDYTVDLNNVADTLVILVGRYSRMSKLLYICIALLVIGIGFIIKAGFEINYLQVSQGQLQAELARATRAVDDAKDEVKSTKDAVEDTKDAVEKVAESTPKVVVDADAGTAKIVLPTKKCRGVECDEPFEPPQPKKGPDSGKKPSPEQPPSPAPPSTGQTVPFNPKVELRDKEAF